MNTVIITGASAGIGKATAIYFSERGWKVVATMRKPEEEEELSEYSNISLKRLDVTDKASIDKAVNETIEEQGKVDCLVNNAGIGVFGAFEAATEGEIKRQFDTNVFGVMQTIRSILPHFRARNTGMIINISSGVGKVPLPMQSLYGATKFAIEGFTESLSYELSALGIKAKLVLPGNIKTDFFKSLTVTDIGDYPDYKPYQDRVLDNIERLNVSSGASPEYVAKVIYTAATDGKSKLRYMAGKDIALFSIVRKLLPDSLFMKIVKSRLE